MFNKECERTVMGLSAALGMTGALVAGLLGLG